MRKTQNVSGVTGGLRLSVAVLCCEAVILLYCVYQLINQRNILISSALIGLEILIQIKFKHSNNGTVHQRVLQ